MPRASPVIDVHAHPPTKEYLVDAGGHYHAHALAYFKRALKPKPLSRMVAEYERWGIDRAVLLGWDASTATGLPPVRNDTIAAAVKRWPRFFTGFGSVDPLKPEKAVEEARRCAEVLGLRGLKFHQSAQAFRPNEARLEPLWRYCEKAGLIALFHTGTTGFGAGGPGGDGVLLDYARPVPYIDEVAASHPDLRIVCAHAGWPWHEEVLAMALHKPNVWIDLSGWLPKYLPEIVWKYAGSLLQDRVMFGSDYPFVTPDRWLLGFADVQLKPDVKRKVLGGNAARLLR